MTSEIFDKLQELISNKLGIDSGEIRLDSHLQEDFDADALSISDLIDTIEKEFELKFDQGQVANVNTVEDIVNLIADQSN